jgi:hypothetical protein
VRNLYREGLDGRARCDSGKVFEALPGDLMWTPTTRAQHSRTGLRYGSDLTDAEWLILSPFLSPPSGRGCPRKWEMREIVNAIFYVLRGGVAWSLLPKDSRPGPRCTAGSPGSATMAPGSGSTTTW